jgi:hypothetical protein
MSTHLRLGLPSGFLPPGFTMLLLPTILSSRHSAIEQSERLFHNIVYTTGANKRMFMIGEVQRIKE